jgi:hypothetical protein
MFSNKRQMQVNEAVKIAEFLHVPLDEVLVHADGTNRSAAADDAIRQLLTGTVDEEGFLSPLPQDVLLPEQTLHRALSTVLPLGGTYTAAQVRAAHGPLTLVDDYIVVYRVTDLIEPDAAGALCMVTLRDGRQKLAYVDRVRKTGEATIRSMSGEHSDEVLLAAAPVLSIMM